MVIIMKRFKRIGAFLLSAAVMLSMIPAVVTAAEPAAAAEAAGEKQQILQKLQIIPEEFDVQAQMTRGDFIKSLRICSARIPQIKQQKDLLTSTVSRHRWARLHW